MPRLELLMSILCSISILSLNSKYTERSIFFSSNLYLINEAFKSQKVNSAFANLMFVYQIVNILHHFGPVHNLFEMKMNKIRR